MIKYRDGSPINIGDIVYWSTNNHVVRRGKIVKVIEKIHRNKTLRYVTILPESETDYPIAIYRTNRIYRHSHCSECPGPIDIFKGKNEHTD